MNFEYTGRHLEVTPAIRSHVEEHFKKIDHLFEGSPASAHVIIEVEHAMSRSEVILTWRNETVTANSELPDMYQSLTQTLDKVTVQARKLKDKVIDKSHRAKPLAEVAAMMEPDETI